MLAQGSAASIVDDPYLWLEDVGGDTALKWVRARNSLAEKEFAADPRYEPLRADLLAILNSQERIPYVTRMNEHVYNFWRDAANPRGLWRRTTLTEYRKAAAGMGGRHRSRRSGGGRQGELGLEGRRLPAAGAAWRALRRCLVALSRGGADATVVREFDLQDKHFVADGFNLPTEAKQEMAWKDADTVWVAQRFRPGLHDHSGYPRIVKEWKRGTALSAARTVYEGKSADVGVEAWSERESGQRRDWVIATFSFGTPSVSSKGTVHWYGLRCRPMPRSSPFKDWLLIRTRSPWTIAGKTWPGGALLAIHFDAFMKGGRTFDLLYEPTARSSLEDVSETRSAVLVRELENVRPRLWEFQHDGRQWQATFRAVAGTGSARPSFDLLGQRRLHADSPGLHHPDDAARAPRRRCEASH